MSVFLANLKLNVKKGLQYRKSAISGFFTQMFFGFMQIALYKAFLSQGGSEFTIEQMASYIWLQQVFFTLFNFWDTAKEEISRKIENGDIAYQLIRPTNLYSYWYSINYSKPIGTLILRGLPLAIFALILPKGTCLMLPVGFDNFLMFVMASIFGSLLVASINTLSHVIVLYVMSSKGVFGFMAAIGNFCAGAVVPLPMLPEPVQKVLNFLPFRYVSDLPYRIYVGNINGLDALAQIGLQVLWLGILFGLGHLLTHLRLKKLVVQGG